MKYLSVFMAALGALMLLLNNPDYATAFVVLAIWCVQIEKVN